MDTTAETADPEWRPYEASDAPAVTELVNLVAVHAGGRPGFTTRELADLVAALVRDLASDSTLVSTADGTLVGAGFTTTPPTGGFRVHVTGGVHPHWRGRGIGRRLLRRHLDRAAAIHRETAPGIPWEAHLRTPADDEDAARLFRRFGLTPARYWFEMNAPVGPSAAARPAVEVPAGLRVEPYSAEFDAAVHAAHMDAFSANWAFQHRDRAGWFATTVRSAIFRPDLSVLAFEEGSYALVGYALSYDHADVGRIYVGHVGVVRPWRRRGLAAALLARVLDAAAADGQLTVGLSVDADSPTGAVGVYTRAGFAVESRTVTHSLRIGG